ncbi:Ethanolamine kinase 2 [Liparis tanakae]|uniref:Ethanolamine kinase 2 n=1 Tax=Liparis tanakae TaxID=230148 RepID=A0A4Z2IH37_9TELE|nr:Ethanolamine kinase 2 [Liparis tanakae]
MGAVATQRRPEVTEASNFFWGLWGILQSRFSSIDFDFLRLVFCDGGLHPLAVRPGVGVWL